MKKAIHLVFLVLLSSAEIGAHAQHFTGPWDLDTLRKAPPAKWGQSTNLVQEVYYEGPSFQGGPTRVFAYCGRPEGGVGPFPAMVLVHGGGGKAFAKWAEHWAKRGYVALAMDLAGNGPDGQRLPDGGPDQSDKTKFRDFEESEANQIKYLGGVEFPILFLNGSNDFAYPLDSYRRSYQLVKGPMTLSVKIGLPHGHIWTFGEVDAFVDSVLKGGEPLPRLSPMTIDRGSGTAAAGYSAKIAVKKGELHYTTDGGPWQKRVWKSVGADPSEGRVAAKLPAERPLVFFLSVTDERGLTSTTPHQDL